MTNALCMASLLVTSAFCCSLQAAPVREQTFRLNGLMSNAPIPVDETLATFARPNKIAGVASADKYIDCKSQGEVCMVPVLVTGIEISDKKCSVKVRLPEAVASSGVTTGGKPQTIKWIIQFSHPKFNISKFLFDNNKMGVEIELHGKDHFSHVRTDANSSEWSRKQGDLEFAMFSYKLHLTVTDPANENNVVECDFIDPLIINRN